MTQKKTKKGNLYHLNFYTAEGKGKYLQHMTGFLMSSVYELTSVGKKKQTN